MAKKAGKGGGKRKTRDDVPGASGNAPRAGDNSEGRTPDEVRQGFIDHRQAWLRATAKQKVLDELWRDTKAALKADGYTVKQMQIADALAGSPKAEAKVQAEVRDRLQVALWIGHPMGAQLDLFSQPDRTPSVDRAFDLGKQASMENKARKPPHDPSTEQYRAWMEGYDEHQGTLAAGFKKIPASEATAGEPVTRKEFQKRLREQTTGDNDPNAQPAPGEKVH